MENKGSSLGRESYGLVIIIILFIFIWVFAVAGINITYSLVNPNIMLCLIYIGCSSALIVMSYLIKVRGTVYWITSYSFKEAQKMTDEKRMMIGSIFFKVMGGTNIALVFYLVVSIILGFGILADMVIYFTGILISSIYGIRRLTTLV